MIPGGLSPMGSMALGMGAPGGPAPQRPQLATQLPQLTGVSAQDPRSVYLAEALQAMQNQSQGSAQGAGENLLATALDQYALQQRRQQLMQGAQQTGAGATPGATSDGW